VGGLVGLLKKKTKPKNIILKLSSRGIVCTSNRKGEKLVSIGTFADNVLDPVGSGDALLAYSSLILKITNSIATAGIIGSIAAACECEIDGNKPITIDLVLQKIDKIEKNTRYN
jgi:sugar/nucleoside kinase (ribokinase family)